MFMQSGSFLNPVTRYDFGICKTSLATCAYYYYYDTCIDIRQRRSLTYSVCFAVGSSTPPLQHRLVFARSRDESRITMAIQRVPHTQWRELGERLSLAHKDIQLLTQANPQNKQVISDAVQRWLTSQQGDALSTLTRVLMDMNLHTIASLLLQHSDNDSLWLK